jgi:Na+/melibiose symporter-like transporter
LALFGLPEFATYLAVIPISLYIPFFYSRDLGLSITAVGLVLMVARISDVVIDPLIGVLSDRTKLRWGRRKIWMVAGAPVMMVSACALFVATSPVTNLYLLGWSMLLWLGWTMINIPYYAWGAELSSDFDERTQITGWRQAWGFAGNISVLLVPVAAAKLFGYGGVAREALVIIAGMVVVLLPLLIGLTVWRLPERTVAAPARQAILRNARAMFANGSFLILFFGFTLMSLGTTMIGTLFMLFTTFAMDLERHAQPILLAYFAVNLVGLPFWVWLSHRIGKREAWITGTLIMALVTPAYLFLSPGDLLPFVLITGGDRLCRRQLHSAIDVDEGRRDRGGLAAAARNRCRHLRGRLVARIEGNAGARSGRVSAVARPVRLRPAHRKRARTRSRRCDIRLRCCRRRVTSEAILIISRYGISKARLDRLRLAFDRRESRRIHVLPQQ